MAAREVRDELIYGIDICIGIGILRLNVLNKRVIIIIVEPVLRSFRTAARRAPTNQQPRRMVTRESPNRHYVPINHPVSYCKPFDEYKKRRVNSHSYG